eukprot:1137925-Pelagomonas_calceolata.AAC.4
MRQQTQGGLGERGKGKHRPYYYYIRCFAAAIQCGNKRRAAWVREEREAQGLSRMQCSRAIRRCTATLQCGIGRKVAYVTGGKESTGLRLCALQQPSRRAEPTLNAAANAGLPV